MTRQIVKWKHRHGWCGAKPAHNPNLWIELDELAAHNCCDLLARHAASARRSSWRTTAVMRRFDWISEQD